MSTKTNAIEIPAPDQHPACPLCGSTRDGIEVGTRGRFGLPVRNVVCETCTLVYVSPRPSAKAMADYYATSYRAHFGEQKVACRRADGSAAAPGGIEYELEMESWHQSQAIAACELAQIRAGERVLEVGCHGGRTLAIQRVRVGIVPFGIEPDVHEAERSRAAGIPCFCGVLEDFDPGDDRFDVVQLFHVLEHLHDPVSALVKMRTWLGPGGRIVIEVPNAYTPYGPLEENFFQHVHLTTFSNDTLAAACARAGFRVLRVFEGGALHLCAAVDSEVGAVPLPFTRDLLPDPEHDAHWVADRLRSYAELEKLATSFERSPNAEAIGRMGELMAGPSFSIHVIETLSRTVEGLVGAGQLELALELARAATRGPHPLEAKSCILGLCAELGSLVRTRAGRELGA